ncbi:transposase [Kitasatospora purpeofusca]|uniref:transposase n=1 Tax=Kitasatospora purpeofusca TaxID=67352 RepID=UPI002E126EE6|nr:transposase [Kitasatospora purpeofusca]
MTTRRPIDVLADRAAGTFATWLRDRPELRVVCRDRAGSFREGAQAGAPQAVQVADSWHLLNNLAQAVERVIGRHRVDLRDPLTPHDDGPHRHDGELDIHGRPRPLVARTREPHRQIDERMDRGDINTVRRHLKPYRNGKIPTTAPLPHPSVRSVTDWIMRRPEHLTDIERKISTSCADGTPPSRRPSSTPAASR